MNQGQWKEKELFVMPEMQIIEFETEDVITTSGAMEPTIKSDFMVNSSANQLSMQTGEWK